MPCIRTAAKAFHEGVTYDDYVSAVAASLEDDFEYSPITALEFARDDFKGITKACYSATKAPKEAAKEIDAKYMGGNEGRKKAEGHEGWDGWEEVEGLEDSIEGIENLAYELRHCIRGAKTQCKDWKALALYVKGLASNLDDAAELMAYKTDSDNDDESANEAKTKKGGLDEDVVKVMGHYIPKGIWTAISRFATSNTDQRQTGFFGSAEMKKRYIDFTNSMVQYIEQNIKKADPKEQGFIANNLKKLKTERDSLVSKLMVMEGRRNEGLTNFRFKDPETEDDLIGIEDFICEVYRRNKGEDAAEKIQDRMDSLQGQASSKYVKEKGKDAFDKLEGAAYAQFLFNAIRSIVNGITQEDFNMVYTSPGTDKEYLQEVVLCDKEVEQPEYRADDMYDLSSLRK